MYKFILNKSIKWQLWWDRDDAGLFLKPFPLKQFYSSLLDHFFKLIIYILAYTQVDYLMEKLAQVLEH